MSHPFPAESRISAVRDVRTAEVGVPMRVYAPARGDGSAVLWLHGGGFTGGSYDDPEGDGVARALCASGSTVVTVQYRHADPAHSVFYPLPSDDVVAAWRWLDAAAGVLGAHGARHLGGASAGANLALGAALRIRDAGDPMPATVMLAYPTLHARQRDPDPDLALLLDRLPPAERWSADLVQAMYRSYLGDLAEAPPVYAVPGPADPTGLPPVLILASEVDGLRASAQEYAELLRDAGHPHRYVVEPGALHGHLNTPGVPQSARSLRQLTTWVQNHDR